MKFDRDIYFDTIRPLFGSMSQEQVDGQKYLLLYWEKQPTSRDLRYFAYMLATTKHETASTMLPIEEYGKGSGHEYGEPHPETGQVYYGRGDVQLTWYDNYLYAEKQLGLKGEKSLVDFPSNALDPMIAAEIMSRGMTEGWFRKGETLGKYFNDITDDPFGAREIINGDKNVVPDWSGGVSIGQLIADAHSAFLNALQSSLVVGTEVPEFIPIRPVVRLKIYIPKGVDVEIEEIVS